MIRTISLVLALAIGAFAQAPIPATFYGMHVNNQNAAFPSIPVGAIRLWDTQTGWSQINTAPGVFNWTVLDALVAKARANNADVMYDLARTPAWAQCAPTNAGCSSGTVFTCAYAPSGAGQCYPPADLNTDGTGTDQHWIDWITAVVTRYKGKIKFYEIWNEQNNPPQWQGSSAQLVRMERDARCIIVGTSAGCSNLSTFAATGIDGGFALIATPAAANVAGSNATAGTNAFLQAGGGAYADVIDFHGYVGNNPPEQIATIVGNLTAAIAANQQGSKPILDSEASWGQSNPVTDPDQQAAWIARFSLLQASLGISRLYWYAWDLPAVGLWSASSGITQAGVAFGQLTKWTAGATPVGPCAAIATVWSCEYTFADGSKARAVWDTSQTCSSGTCSTSSYSAPLQFLTYIDLAGKQLGIPNGAVRIGLKPVLLQAPIPSPTRCRYKNPHAVTLSWDAVPAATSYRIYKSPNLSGFTVFASSATNKYTDAGIPGSTTEFYGVTAIVASAESGLSNIVRTVTPCGRGRVADGGTFR